MPASNVPKSSTIGKKFGRLTAVCFTRWRIFKSGKRHAIWLFRCECGKHTEALLPNVKSRHTSSCGCLGNENRAERVRLNTKHGDARKGKQDHLYIVWCAIKQRCEDPNYHRFPDWGGRGIKVIWTHYEAFRGDMAPTYRKGLQIERRDNNGHYCKQNCYWATAKQQARNRRSNVILELNGRRKHLIDWAEETGIDRRTISARLKRGWSQEKALTVPTPKSNANKSGLRFQ